MTAGSQSYSSGMGTYTSGVSPKFRKGVEYVLNESEGEDDSRAHPSTNSEL